MKYIEGGIVAPKGFKASGVHAGIRKNKQKKDLALIVSDTLASAASVYTLNLVKGAPIYVTKENLENGKAQAIICNSGNANTCNSNGIEIAKGMCELVEKHTKISTKDVIVASTGVIGQKLDLTPIASAMDDLVGSLKSTESASDDCNDAILTTDTIRKQAAISFNLNGKECRIGGIAKGSGMIHPNMATMLVFLTTDAAISPDMLLEALKTDVDDTFNMISVDGDTSTNDMLSILANGMAGNTCIENKNDDYYVFLSALNKITTYLCKLIAKDGEGATKLIECKVINAKDKLTARAAAKSVITSSLLKAAMFGQDANWGRILCAVGNCNKDIDINKIDVEFNSESGTLKVCEKGFGVDFSEEFAKKVLSEKEITININLNDGTYAATAWGCDLTYDYVKINGDYRT